MERVDKAVVAKVKPVVRKPKIMLPKTPKTPKVEMAKAKASGSAKPKVARPPIVFPAQPQFFCPLQIDMVLANVMSYLPLPDLINCRLVNPQWNAHSSATIVQKGLAEMTLQNKLKQAKADPLVTAITKEFTAVMKKSNQNIFTRYAIRNVSLHSPVFVKMFNVCQSSIRELTLEIKQKSHLDLKTFTHIMVRLAPNLVALRMPRMPEVVLQAENWFLSPEAEVAPTPVFPKLTLIAFPFLEFLPSELGRIWLRLFEASPALNEVQVVRYNDQKHFHLFRGQPNEHSSLTGMLRDSGKLYQLTKIRSFQKLRTGDVNILTSAAEKGLALVELELMTITGFFVAKASLEAFLKSQSGSLKKLSLGNITPHCCRGGGRTLMLPKLQAVEHFSLSLSQGAVALENHDLGECLPQLKVLYLYVRGDFPKSSLYMGSVVRNLRLTFSKSMLDYGNDSARLLWTFGRLHTCVENLELVNPSEEQFDFLSSAWPNLKHLTVTFNERDTMGRLGFRNVFRQPEDFARVVTILNKALDKSSELRIRFPVLWQLKKLESFKIDQGIHVVKGVKRDRSGVTFFVRTIYLANHPIKNA